MSSRNRKRVKCRVVRRRRTSGGSRVVVLRCRIKNRRRDRRSSSF
ncbi:hypothetical protein [Fictibacillus sp. NRS-1165]